MQAPLKIWIYSLPNTHYLIAKRRPFSYQIPIMDYTGTWSYKVINGTQIEQPVWEHIVKDADGHVWATFQDNIYNITDLYI
jgi:hypothetical protein